MLRRTLVMLIAVSFLSAIAGCTLYPDKKPPTAASTTSAEQLERIYWDAVKAGDWQKAQALQGPNVLFTNRNGEHLSGPQWLDWLKQNPPAEYMIGTVQVTPQGPDVIVSYFASVTFKGSTTPVEMAVVSGWQQVGPNLLMVVHSETPRVPPAK